MPYLALTLIENLKLQLSPGLVASNYVQPGNEVGLFWDKHTHFYSLTCSGTTRGETVQAYVSYYLLTATRTVDFDWHQNR